MSPNSKDNPQQYFGAGIGIGLALGVGAGVVLGDVAAGIGIGLAVGVLFGWAIVRSRTAAFREKETGNE